MSFPLLANPNRHYYTSRRGKILGIVLHVTAGLEDFTPPDSGAEATIRYGLSNSRPASWHGIVDSDSVIDCLPDAYTAFHVVGYNSHTLGLEIANRDARWAGKPQRWVDATIANAAAWCRPRVAKYGLPVNLADKAEVDRCIRAGRPFGFTYHRYLDPTRRIDPGRDFPWQQFAAHLTADTAKPAPPPFTMSPTVRCLAASCAEIARPSGPLRWFKRFSAEAKPWQKSGNPFGADGFWEESLFARECWSASVIESNRGSANPIRAKR